MINKLMILYFSSLDHRRINEKTTPYLFGLSEKYPIIKVNTIPDPDMKTTLWTGRYPHEHKMWQVCLKDDRNFDTAKLWDSLPDIITTTFQCFVHCITGKFDLAGVPDWRRRRFEIHKSKYFWKGSKLPLRFNGLDTLFNIVGRSNCNLFHETSFRKIIRNLTKDFIKDKKLEVFDAHGTDLYTHWNIDKEERMNDAYFRIDGRIKEMHEECRKRGITVMILSDHAQARVEETIDIAEKIEDLGIRKNEMSYFIEAPRARFWFHSESAREKMLEYLSGNDKGTLLHFEELYKYNIEFDDDSYGEYYFITNPGVVFYPNDFYHPLGNLYLALKNEEQRARIKSPVYRGYHGHLPFNECEKGFVMLLDDDHKPERDEIEIIDVMPTVLRLLGYDKPDSLKGVHAFDG